VNKALIRALAVAVTVVMAVVWVLGGGSGKGGGEPWRDRTGEILARLEAAGEEWRVEGMFYAYQNAERGRGFLGAEQLASGEEGAPGSRRVLVLGDSYTFGTGLIDLDLRWPRQLEDMLRAEDEAWRVSSLALGGASTFTQAEWLRAVQAGEWGTLSRDPEQARAELKDGIDVLVLGFVANDVLPGWLDGSEPDYELEDRVLRGEVQNPYGAKWREALAKLAQAPVERKIVMLLDFAEPGRAYAEQLRPVFAELGFEVVNGYALAKRTGDLTVDDLIVHPADAHPGPAVLRAYAEDAARGILGGQNRTASREGRHDVSNVLPVASAVESGEGTATVRFLDAHRLVSPCGRTWPCMLVGEPFMLEGESRYPRTYPCAPIGAPHGYIGIAGGEEIEVRVVGGDAWLVPVVQDEVGRVRDLASVQGKSGRPVRIRAQGLKGLRVVQKPGSGCEEPDAFSAVSVQIAWR